jgi:hypothetical protein
MVEPVDFDLANLECDALTSAAICEGGDRASCDEFNTGHKVELFWPNQYSPESFDCRTNQFRELIDPVLSNP